MYLAHISHTGLNYLLEMPTYDLYILYNEANGLIKAMNQTAA